MNSTERPGLLFMLIGPGGAGKNALINQILRDFGDIRQLPTATTRSPRPGEQDGREHQFVRLAQFQQMIDDGELLEHQEVHPGKFYGVPRKTVDDAIRTQCDLIADIEFKGATIISALYPKTTIPIFIAPPSIDELVNRLKSRNASHDDIQDRLRRLPAEMLYAPSSKYLIVNDEIEQSVHELAAIITTEREHYGKPNGMITLSNEVAFRVEVFIQQDHKTLIHQDGAIPHTQLEFGQKPGDVALKFVSDLTGTNAQIDALSYQHPLNEMPLQLEYAPSQGQYKLVYAFTYNLTEPMLSPRNDIIWQALEVEHESA